MFLVKAEISSSGMSSSLTKEATYTTNTFEVISHRAPDRP